MKTWKKLCTGLVAFGGLTPGIWAQAPASAGGAAASPAGAASTASGNAAPANFWDFLMKLHDKKADCKEKFCQTQAGKFAANMLKPISGMTGGMIGPCCPVATKEDLAKPADSADGAAAQIKKDEAEAKKRAENVTFLGTVDCHWWPEAQAALINALRADKNECVRLAAARALGRGCCCNKAIIKSLTICVTGSEEDKNPSENSERVKMYATIALNHCLACVPEAASKGEPAKSPQGEPAKDKAGEKSASKSGGKGHANDFLPAYYKEIESGEFKPVIEAAKLAMQQANAPVATTADSTGKTVPAKGNRLKGTSVYDIVSGAASATKSAKPAAPTMPTEALAGRHGRFVTLDSIKGGDEKLIATPEPAPAVMLETPHVVPGIYKPAPVQEKNIEIKKETAVREAIKPVQAAPLPIAQPMIKASSVQAPAPTQELWQVPATPRQPIRPSVYQSAAYPAAPAPVPAPIPKPALLPNPWPTVRPTTAQTSPMDAPPALQQTVRTVSYSTPAPAPSVSSTSVPVADGQPKQTVEEMLSFLRNSAYPELREFNAARLSTPEMKNNREVFQAVLSAARTDPEPSVRMACIRGIAVMGVYSPAALITLQDLMKDPNAAVRAEAERSLARLNAGN